MFSKSDSIKGEERKKNHQRKTSLPAHLNLVSGQTHVSGHRHRHTDPGLPSARNVSRDSGITEEVSDTCDTAISQMTKSKVLRSEAEQETLSVQDSFDQSSPSACAVPNSGNGRTKIAANNGAGPSGVTGTALHNQTDSSDSGTSMSLISSGDNSGGSIPQAGPGFTSALQSAEEEEPRDREEVLRSGDGRLSVNNGCDSLNGIMHRSTSGDIHSSINHSGGLGPNGRQQESQVHSQVAAIIGLPGGREGGAAVVSSMGGQTVVNRTDQGGALRGCTPDPPSLPPRTYKEQPAPPLPPRHHRREKEAPPLPPRHNSEKVHRKRQAEPVPMERTMSLDLPPPPLPPRTYSPIHMASGSHSPGSAIPSSQVPDGGSSEGFAPISHCDNSHHHHVSFESPSTSNESASTSREDDSMDALSRSQVGCQHPQSRHSVAELERTRGRDPLLAQNLGLINQARERNSLPVLTDNSPSLHSGGITPPVRPHPRLVRTSAMDQSLGHRPQPPLVSSISEQTPPTAHEHTELQRLRGRSVDAVSSEQGGMTPSSSTVMPPRLQPRVRMSEEERQQQWQQINQQLQLWTRRQKKRVESPQLDAHGHSPGPDSDEMTMSFNECESSHLEAPTLPSSMSSPHISAQSAHGAHSPLASGQQGLDDMLDGREGRMRSSVASSNSHSRDNGTPHVALSRSASSGHAHSRSTGKA